MDTLRRILDLAKELPSEKLGDEVKKIANRRFELVKCNHNGGCVLCCLENDPSMCAIYSKSCGNGDDYIKEIK